MKCSDGQYFEPPQVNIGDDTAQKFLEQVLAAATICRQYLINNIPRKRLTQGKWRKCNNVTNCSIGAKPFKSTDTKVCDHEHLIGEYRGPARNACNLNYHTHAFLFNTWNYSHEVRNNQRREAKLNINLQRLNNFDIKQKTARKW